MPLSSAVPASSAKKSCFIWLGEFDLCHSGVLHTENFCWNSEIHIKEIIMPNASISRAHILLQLRRREKSEELPNFADTYTESATSEFYHKF